MATRRPVPSFACAAFVVLVSPAVGASADLVGWWPFEESSGLLAEDGSTFANHGTLHDAVRVDGVVGRALSFDGQAAFVQVPHAAQYDITDAVSVEAWIRMAPVQYYAQPNVLDKSHRGAIAPPYWTGYTLQAAPGGGMAINFVALTGSAAPEVSSITPLNDGEWHFLAGTASTADAVMRFYLDGVMTQEIPYAGPTAVNDGDLFIGRCWWAEERYFAGIIDEVRVYHGALTSEEVQEHYFDGVGAELVGWWSFDETSGPTVLDGSSFANPGTIHAAARVAGISGGALSFDGQTSYVQIPYAAQYDITDAVSLEAWIRMSPTQYYTQPNVFDKSHRFWSGYTLQAALDGGMAMDFVAMTEGSAPEASSVVSLNDDKWHFVAGTSSSRSGVMRFYLDGVMAQEVPFAGPIGVNDGDVLIGRFWEWQERYFAGLIDEVKVYRGALTAAQIVAHWGEAVDAPLAQASRPGSILRLAPNPTRGPVWIECIPAPAGLRIYDSAGRLVRMLSSGGLGAGSSRVYWDARDDAGRAVSAGVYFVRVEASIGPAGRTVVVR